MGLCMVVVPAMAACEGDSASTAPATFESVEALRAAADAAPGFSCERPVGERWDEVHDDFGARFTGLETFAACIEDGGPHYLLVFDDAGHLDSFVDSQGWVDFERVFAPVDDGQTFTGAAGQNWIITNFEPAPEFLERMAAERVGSQPARGASPTN
jgi:hypothetical protein